MPTYNIKNVETGDIEEMILSLSEREELLNSGKYTQELSLPNFVSMAGGTLARTSGDWKNLLTKMKKETGRGNLIKD
jgi:hypothetical protein|tara:strand:- start:569 stop:799 length:231 start_codon:yes stop_codon:yes gene_type:complete